ncbi:MAG: endo-1,4-beta-xylanase, partial [Planctomycetota bacterium]
MPSDRTARPFAVRRLLGLAAAVTIASLASVDVAAAQQWRDEANARIDQHRKGDMTVRVFDAAGNRVQGADVGVSMLNHNFGFGTAVTAELLTANSQDATNYRNAIRNNFNHVVFENDLKWPAWEGQWGPNFNWTQTQQAMDWLDANNLPARGHYLSWATWTGFDAYGDSQNVNTLKTRLFDHITEKATTVGDRVYEWDVINHPVGWTNDTYVNRMQDAGLYNNGLDFYADIIRHSRSVVPDGTDLWINEDNIMSGGLASEYADIIEYLNDNGAAVDGIGFQGHFNADWNRIRTPQQVYNNIDRFAGLADRLRVTEFDINVGTESEQAELTRDYLTVMFSHEKMEAVTFWGFWEGRHWLENAHLINEDWTEKPAMAAYRDLVFDEWWTEEDLDASELGEAELRAVLGAYEITASLGH